MDFGLIMMFVGLIGFVLIRLKRNELENALITSMKERFKSIEDRLDILEKNK